MKMVSHFFCPALLLLVPMPEFFSPPTVCLSLKKKYKYRYDKINPAAYLTFVGQITLFLSNWHVTCSFNADQGRLVDSFS